MTNMTTSTADLGIGFQSDKAQLWLPQSILQSVCTGWSTWQYIVTVLVGLVVYGQGGYIIRSKKNQLTLCISDLHQEKGQHCRSFLQDSIHGSLPPSTRSKVRLLSQTVGEWTSQLCLCLP